MKYENLPQELRDQLEATRLVLVRRSSLVDDNSINDAICLSKDTEADLNQFDGYEAGTVEDWFDLVTRPYEDNEAMCIRIAKEALLAV
jgi:hypothetical protein